MRFFKDRIDMLVEERAFRGPLFASAVAIISFLVDPLIDAISKTPEGAMRELMGAPIWAWGLIAAGVIMAVSSYEGMYRMRRRIKGGRRALSELRAKGVELRGLGRYDFADNSSWLQWKGRVLQWDQDVLTELRRINEADAVWFEVLDVVWWWYPRVPFRGTPGTNDEQKKLYRELDARLDNLGEMIRDLWRGGE